MAKRKSPDRVYMIKSIPFPVGSIVRFKEATSVNSLLVSEIEFSSGLPKYCLLGHSKLKTKGEGIAWIDHDDLELVSQPDHTSWGMLLSTRDNALG